MLKSQQRVTTNEDTGARESSNFEFKLYQAGVADFLAVKKENFRFDSENIAISKSSVTSDSMN